MTENFEKCLKVATNCARYAGKVIRTKMSECKTIVETKTSDIDLVTETDKEIEKYLITTLKSSFPHHSFIGEESVAGGALCQLTNDPTWIIDPVDGTMNFVHGYPNVCVSIGLYVNKIPEVAIVYNPIIEYFFEARRDKGATLNGKRIRVSNNTALSKCLLGFEFGTSRDAEKQTNVLTNVSNIIKKVHGVRSSGSAAMNMALVALGAIDAYYEFGIHAWDVAAGELLVKEAGGVVIDPDGGQFDILSRRVLCACSQTVANQLSKELTQLYPTRD